MHRLDPPFRRHALNGFGVDPTTGEIVHCRPAHIRQVGAGFGVTERLALVRFRCTF